ncbi:MAG: hypothetical protein ACM31L_14665 [Actinomycetota bacterium]
MSKRLKVLIFIDHDIIIRHFVHSGVFSQLMASHDVKFCFLPETYKGGARINQPLDQLGLGDRMMRVDVDTERLRMWSKLVQVGRLRWRPGTHAKAMRDMMRNAIGPGHVREYTTLALPGVYWWFQRETLKRLAAKPNAILNALYDTEKPDIILHPSVLFGPFIHDLCAVSAERGVPMVTIMNSWDNPATKANMFLKPDRLLVWGEQTKGHAIKYVGMKPDKVTIFGAAQFDVYRHPPRIDRAEFERIHSIPAGRKIVLYGGSSKGTDEFAHLCMLDDAIDAGKLGNSVIVYRPHPWGVGGKDGGRIADHPWRNVYLETFSRGYLEDLRSESKVTYPDYRDTVDTLSNVDAVISPLSTIIVEAAMFGKPALCFLPLDDGAKHFDLAYRLAHFEDIYTSPDYLKAWGVEQLLDKTAELVERIGDDALSKRLADESRYYAERFDQAYGERLVALIEAICAGSA